jgi:hypothetical protein
VRLRDRRDDRQPQARTAPRASRVAAAEALEGALQEAVGKAVALVSHVQLDPVAGRLCCERDIAVAVGECVRDEVVERLRGTKRIGQQDQFGWRVDLKRPARGSCGSRGAPRRVGQQLPRAKRLRLNGQLPAIGAREHQQVGGEPGQPPRLVLNGLERRAQLRRVALAPERHLDLGEEYGQRRAKLVARVREQAALAQDGAVQPREQLVQRAAQCLDLVVRARDRKPLGRVALGDPLGTNTHALDGAQRGSRDLVARIGGQHQSERADDEEQLREPVKRVVAPVEGLRHSHRERAGGGVGDPHLNAALADRGVHAPDAEVPAAGAARLRHGEEPRARERRRGCGQRAVRVVHLSELLPAAHEARVRPARGHQGRRVGRAARQVLVDDLVEVAPELREEDEPAHRQHRRKHPRECDRQAEADRQPAEGELHRVCGYPPSPEDGSTAVGCLASVALTVP